MLACASGDSMNYFDVVEARRSVRKFKAEKLADTVIEKALQAAVLAPNSSNTQTWDFYWVQTPEKKDKLVAACLSQSAARTASDLIVVVANPKTWKRSVKPLIQWVESVKAPQQVQMYYKKLIPIMYRSGLFNSLGLLKFILATLTGLFRPIMRSPFFRRDMQEVAIKSAALACENFVLAIKAQGGDTCMMEGFDEYRVKSLLKLPCSARVVMVIAVGLGAENGTWGPRFRLPLEQVMHKI